jgi:hypothetical protein
VLFELNAKANKRILAYEFRTRANVKSFGFSFKIHPCLNQIKRFHVLLSRVHFLKIKDDVYKKGKFAVQSFFSEKSCVFKGDRLICFFIQLDKRD